jgi:hypothetical protein
VRNKSNQEVVFKKKKTTKKGVFVDYFQHNYSRTGTMNEKKKIKILRSDKNK